jgi:hypothetical protein
MRTHGGTLGKTAGAWCDKEREMRRKWFLWGDLTSTVFAITCFWFAWKEAEQWLSFAGFGALFMMLIYSACMGFLGLGGIFLALAIGSGKRRFLIASLVCRGLVLAGWFWLWAAIPSLWSWTETGCGAVGVTMVMGLIADWQREDRDT